MPNNDVQLIKSRLDIVEFIGDKVKLRKAGRNYIGLCPFHSEKTPSFHVSRERQNYHCFGCGKGGDIFTFVMETEGYNFQQALNVLAERAGVSISYSSKERTDNFKNKERVKNLYDVMNLAANFFSHNLKMSSAAIAYLQRRNLTPLDAARFNLGWSFRSWDSLLNFLKQNGVSERQALSAGLIIAGEHGGFYDRFRGRLIFPVKDLTGKIIAFGGRLVDGEGAKYINSPEGEIYSKRDNLYLLNDAKNFIRERKRAILVEGYMDAVRLHIAGFGETVASLGTSLTEQQARLIKRFTDNCYICYDSDEAGQEAALRGMYILQESGLNARVISLPSGKDPDELLSDNKINGKELFNNAINNAQPLILHHLNAIKKYLDMPDRRRAALNSFFSGLARLEPSDIAPYIYIITGTLGFNNRIDNFWNELNKFKRYLKNLKLNNFDDKNKKNSEVNELEAQYNNNFINTYKVPVQAEYYEQALCALLWRSRDVRRKVAGDLNKILNILDDENIKNMAAAILTDNTDTLEERWLSLGEIWQMNLIAAGEEICDEILKGGATLKSELDLFDFLCSEIKRQKVRRRYEGLKLKMDRGDASKDEMIEYYALAAEIKN